ncbi:hypothetical protein BC936DRAFT_137812 [Jimgerdemannia flammicorona]|uniref:Uncharacterized protein n=2 Tax=Jimgerdemannia flammicorona TaxID=994334 RepID=A0A433CWL5_9FUNG|nr:hypothetical protein BC936DRAFT_137812 [Jimgerdemannia flammicorona]RUS28664.1 hypothetical protein BC938DRAFT_481614 [Jimgerdemannia flammicorona]
MSVTKTILATTALDFAVQLACFVVAAIYQTEKFYDLVGALSYLACISVSLYWRPFLHEYFFGPIPLSLSSAPALSTFHPRQLLATATTAIWAMRLGTYLFYRVMNDGHDRRFDKVRNKPLVFIRFWIIQAIWVALTALPVYVVNAVPAGTHPAFCVLDYIGFLVWVVGFTLEVTADFQKITWRSKKENKARIIQHGLWSISRHPNYFGEVLLWTGSWFSSISGLARLNDPRVLSLPAAVLTVISPLFVCFVLTKVSGVPMLERLTDKRYGGLAEYQEYKRRVPIFIPWVGRRGDL